VSDVRHDPETQRTFRASPSHPRDALALALLAHRRPTLDRPLDRQGGTPATEFVATLSDEEREVLADVIDAELARREAGSGGATAAETSTL